MRKHLHAVRVVSTCERQMMMKMMWIVDADSQNLTLDDILRVNEIDSRYEFGLNYYVGYMTKKEFEEKYSKKLTVEWMVFE